MPAEVWFHNHPEGMTCTPHCYPVAKEARVWPKPRYFLTHPGLSERSEVIPLSHPHPYNRWTFLVRVRASGAVLRVEHSEVEVTYS